MNLLRGRFFLLGKRFCAGFADFNGLTFGDKSRFLATFFFPPNSEFFEAFFYFLQFFREGGQVFA